MNRFNGKRVLVIGAARQGLALARYLINQQALVTLNDQQTPEQLQQVMQPFAGSGVEWALGGHPLHLLDGKDLVCVSGGVPLTLPLVQAALERGIPLTNDSQIFMETVKAPVVGITGSAGKTTTTSIFGRMAAAALKSPCKAWVGGNIGNPLIEFSEEIDADDLVIQEFSSFQLELMTTSPHIAAVLNITPNHLDRHADMDEYTRAKSRILFHQSTADIAVLNREDMGAWNLRPLVRGALLSFGMERSPSVGNQVYLKDPNIHAEVEGKATELFPVSLISLRGKHNLMNVLAACALALACDFPVEAMVRGIEGFNGVKHRLQFVREVNGVRWYNDSIATAPERSLAALQSFQEPIILLLGGRDKNLPWQPLAQEVKKRARHAVLFGEAGSKIAAALGTPTEVDYLQSISQVGTLQEAVLQAARLASQGDVVLLSPGCTSYDAFKDFEERGEAFIEWVNHL
ncbi:MAG TPA: UDP-N-acetylmuramoyl-L-alanine--D-glutamate ligase [Anaerolineaceae bacterium]|nr:UDP-N-acetylmuramoyl-L-alanine--D-glutamate ligase [Anaerolineaceae bacterium]